MMCGEKGVDRGNALGPWTVQLNLRPETPGFTDVWTSRYAEPDAEGVTPVLRTCKDCQISFQEAKAEPEGALTYRSGCVDGPGSACRPF